MPLRQLVTDHVLHAFVVLQCLARQVSQASHVEQGADAYEYDPRPASLRDEYGLGAWLIVVKRFQ